MAGSFALYGLVRKFVPVPSVVGLTVETAVLFVPALAVVLHAARGPAGSAWRRAAWCPGCWRDRAPVTAMPLLLFHRGRAQARPLDPRLCPVHHAHDPLRAGALLLASRSIRPARSRLRQLMLRGGAPDQRALDLVRDAREGATG
jgi:hypothetical protein